MDPSSSFRNVCESSAAKQAFCHAQLYFSRRQLPKSKYEDNEPLRFRRAFKKA